MDLLESVDNLWFLAQYNFIWGKHDDTRDDTVGGNAFLRKAMNHELCLKLHFIFIRQQ